MDETIEPDLTLEAFAERIAAVVRGRHPAAQVSFVPGDALALHVAWPDGRWHRANLDNMWRSYKLAREGGPDTALEDYLRVIGADEAPSPTLDELVVTVRHASILEATRGGGELVTWPFVADMVTVLAFDRPESIQLATPQDLERLGLEREAAHDHGARNILSRLQVERRGDGPLFMLTADGNYEASLLLNGPLWTQLAAGVAGPLLASAPCRDIIYYTGEHEPGGVEQLTRATAHMVKVGSHVVSRAILRLAKDRWEVVR